MIIRTKKSKKKKQSYKKPDKKEPPKKPRKIDANEFNELINKEEPDIKSELFKKYFSFQRPIEMLKAVYTTKNRRKKEKLVNVIKSGLSDLKNEIKEMSDDVIEIEKPDKIVDIVEKVLEFNRQNQEGQGLQRPDSKTSKTSTPDQMIRRLPTTLEQLKAENNSEKL